MKEPRPRSTRRLLSALVTAALVVRLLSSPGPFGAAPVESLAVAGAISATGVTLGSPAFGQDDFEQRAAPFMTTYCVECHSGWAPKGNFDLKNLGYDLADDETARLWDDVFALVEFAEMPPTTGEHQPSAEEKSAFLELIEAELVSVDRGSGMEHRKLLPQFGNLVDHQSLFDGSVQDAPYTPARLWRQRPIIYDAIWKNAYGKAPWYSIKIGGTGRHVIERGPHKGKLLADRYFSDAKYANPFFEFVHHASGFTDYASILADQSSLEALLVNAETMAQILTEGQKVRIVTQVKNKGSRTGNNEAMFVGGVTTSANEYRGRVPVAFQTIMKTEGEVDRKDFEEALDVVFALFLRRLPRPEEYESYWTNVFQRNAGLGHTMALQSVLIYVTLSPEFVYRMELGLGEADEHGRRFLSPQELVHAVHHALNNSPAFGVDEIETVDVYTKDSEAPVKRIMSTPRPAWSARHTALVADMRDGELKTKDDVERVVRKMLTVKQSGWLVNHNRTYLSTPNPRVLQFFREFFGYYKAPTVFKDVEKFQERDGFRQFQKGTASKLEYDTDSLIRHILLEDKDVLYELLTTNKVVASYWDGLNPELNIQRARGMERYRETHQLQSYNLDPIELAYDRNGSEDPVTRKNGKLFLAPKDQRCGILTQPSWLVAHSGNFDNDPVRRGKWIREKLLAGVVLDVPINVDAQIPDDDQKTLRERFSVVHEQECWRCHKKMNPLGMPFEAYNHVGRWRALEKEKPVNAKGAITHTDDATLDGEVESVREMMERLGRSELVRQSFVRHVFRYWMGRNEMLSDSRTLIAMDQSYVSSGGSFNELLVSLLTSDSFLYRK